MARERKRIKKYCRTLIILTENNIIDERGLDSISLPIQNERKLESVSDYVVVHEIMPLNECIEEVERQLLTLAKEKYQHTTKIAKVLGVNQSTISRKIRNLGVE